MRLAQLALALSLLACKASPPSGAATKTATTNHESASPSASASTTTSTSAPSQASEPMGDASRGKELAAAFECNRCHGGLDLARIDRTRHCVECHQDVIGGKFDGKPKAAQWRKHVAHLSVVPSLAAIGKRMQYDWLVRFIHEPVDLRPALAQTMPRLAISREQARDVAAYLMTIGTGAAETGDGLAGADESRGRKLMDEMQCGLCHRMTGVAELGAAAPLVAPVGAYYAREARETRPAVMLAPDLRFARERMRPAHVIAWLLDPQAVKPDTPMPKTPMSPEQARDIAAYILRTPLAAAPNPRVPDRLEKLDRRVSYDEIAKEVLDVTCRHCHGDPDAALGDGGPGNSGGFGYKPRGINLTSYEHTQGGYLDDQSKRHSLFEKIAYSPSGAAAGELPRIVAALWARHREVAGNPDPNVRGMPLGLPPLPPEQIQLIETWVAQGRPK